MDRPRIKYFTHYASMDPSKLRSGSPAADTKVDYIIEVLNDLGYAVDIISHASVSIGGGFYKGYKEQRGINTIKYFACYGKTPKLINKIFNHFFFNLGFIIWCIINIKKNEQIIVYHSLCYNNIFINLKRILKFKLIGDVEEIYQDVHPTTIKKSKLEYRFFDVCDKFMFPNTILNEKLNKCNKPYIVIHGIYKVKNAECKRNKDNQIHILYSGTYDPVKGGALASIEASAYLSEHYHLHITGFGTNNQEVYLRNKVDEIRPQIKCKITFHGYLNDNDFNDLLRNCSIGLCTQDPTTKLNLTSFPSKILNYMSNGLVVISGRNRAIEESRVGDLLYYYDSQTPIVMAEAIMSIKDTNFSKGVLRLEQLNEELHSEIFEFLK